MNYEPEKSRTYRIGTSSFSIRFGDITSSEADVLVSSDDYMLTMGGGVSAALRRAAGEPTILDAAKKVPAALGDVIVTTAGNLRAQYIFHVITIGPDGTPEEPSSNIRGAMDKCFSLMSKLGVRSIAFPTLGAGMAGYRYEDVAVNMADGVLEAIKGTEQPLDVTLFLFDRFRMLSIFDYAAFFEEFATRLRSTKGREVIELSNQDSESAQHFEAPSRTSKSEREQLLEELADLNRERDKLEETIIRLEGGLQEDMRRALEKQLSEISRNRRRILRRLSERKGAGVEAFISYSHADEKYRIELGKHLRALELQGSIRTWHDRLIEPGKEWESEIHEKLEECELILLLISSDFINSRYCYEVELRRALERHEAGECLVVPVILRPVVWAKAPFAKLQSLPKDGKSVSEWKNSDLAYVNITEGLSLALEELNTVGA